MKTKPETESDQLQRRNRELSILNSIAQADYDQRATAHEVAVAHDGSVALRDEPGWTTSFVARLPVQSERVDLDIARSVSRVGTA